MKSVNNVLNNSKLIIALIVSVVLLTLIINVVYNKLSLRGTTDAKYFEFHSPSGTITDYSYNGPKDVVIPSRINGKEVKAIGDSAFTLEDLRSVVIPNTVTKIGTMAFARNPITSVTIKGDDQQRFNEGWSNIGFDAIPRP